jgi:hypothetical protein
MMRLDLHIGELVLHGTDGMSAGDRERIAADLERELTRLVAEHGVPPALAAGGSVHLESAALALPAGSPAEELGAAIARQAHGRIFGPPVDAAPGVPPPGPPGGPRQAAPTRAAGRETP